jgi:hypothetical protein
MEWEGGGQFTSNLGPGRTRIRKEEGFQVSRRDSGKEELSRESTRGISKGNGRGNS